MAIKIIDLNTEATPTDDDYLVLRDNASGTTKKVTRAAFFLNPPIPNGAITHEMLGTGIIELDNLGASARPTTRVNSITSSSTISHDFASYDITSVSALAVNATITSGAAQYDGQPFLFRIKDNGTARSLTWNIGWAPIGVTLPTTTVPNKWLYVAGRYNAASNLKDILSVARQA